MSGTDVNEGVVGDIAKLMMHRLITRQIRRDPTSVERAKIVHAREADQFAGWPFVHEWDERRLRIKLPRDQDRLPRRGRWKTFERAYDDPGTQACARHTEVKGVQKCPHRALVGSGGIVVFR
jgi:hypothetical protein